MTDINELIKKLNEVQVAYDNVLLQIGLLTAQYFGQERNDLKDLINTKVELLKKLELELREIERKIVESK